MKKYEALMKAISKKKPAPAAGDETKRMILRKKSNAMPTPAPKKDALGASGGWEGMTGKSTAQKIAEMRKAGVDSTTINDMLKSGKKSK